MARIVSEKKAHYTAFVFLAACSQATQPADEKASEIALDDIGSGETRLEDGAPSRIVGGEPSADGAYPWMVSLRIFEDTGNTISLSGPLCGGSLIDQKHVLTAAHCLLDDNNEPRHSAAQLAVAHGTNTTTGLSAENVAFVADWTAHPDYQKAAVADIDLAIVELAEPIDAQPLTLMDLELEDVAVQHNQWVKAIGFGATEPGFLELPEELREVRLPLVGRSQCSQAYSGITWPDGTPAAITNNMVCAGYSDDTIEKSTCSGDSGGPVVSQLAPGLFRLTGVTSFGVCGTPGVPSVSARVANRMPWIESITGPLEQPRIEAQIMSATIRYDENGEVNSQAVAKSESTAVKVFAIPEAAVLAEGRFASKGRAKFDYFNRATGEEESCRYKASDRIDNWVELVCDPSTCPCQEEIEGYPIRWKLTQAYPEERQTTADLRIYTY